MSDVLSHRRLLIVFATAPTGLGHLRVTQALREGLPAGTSPVLLGAEDRFQDMLHRLTSLNSTARAAFEWVQHGRAEDVVTKIGRGMLRTSSSPLRKELAKLVDQRLDRPSHILVVATHFTPAHQVAAFKERIEEQLGIPVVLAVQVTDDSPQHIWMVPGADLIFVPSEATRQGLLEYAREIRVEEPSVAVAPYPVSPLLSEPLPLSARALRAAQLDPASAEPIRVAMPISGAAVGLGFAARLMDALHHKSPRFLFDIVSRNNAYTLPFLNRAIRRGFARVQASRDDRDVVAAYERAYQDSVISLEVTKPSEQCFKALLSPELRGGCVLLLSKPVGRQEYDNIDFLLRHGLMPDGTMQKRLLALARVGKPLAGPGSADLLEAAARWRAIRIPRSAPAATRFIWWCLEQKLFARMLNAPAWQTGSDDRAREVSPHGVRHFWEAVGNHLQQLGFPGEERAIDTELSGEEEPEEPSGTD